MVMELDAPFSLRHVRRHDYRNGFTAIPAVEFENLRPPVITGCLGLSSLISNEAEVSQIRLGGSAYRSAQCRKFRAIGFPDQTRSLTSPVSSNRSTSALFF